MTITHRGAGSCALTHEDRSGVSRDLRTQLAAPTRVIAAPAQLFGHLNDEGHDHRASTRPPVHCERQLAANPRACLSPATFKNGGRAMPP